MLQNKIHIIRIILNLPGLILKFVIIDQKRLNRKFIHVQNVITLIQLILQMKHSVQKWLSIKIAGIVTKLVREQKQVKVVHYAILVKKNDYEIYILIKH